MAVAGTAILAIVGYSLFAVSEILSLSPCIPHNGIISGVSAMLMAVARSLVPSIPAPVVPTPVPVAEKEPDTAPPTDIETGTTYVPLYSI